MFHTREKITSVCMQV